MELAIDFTVIPSGCGHTFAMRIVDYNQLRRSHTTWWCPICCNVRHYADKSDLEVERAKTARAERLMKTREEERNSARARARTADYQARAAKGNLTKARKRWAAGFCPCCEQQFKNVRRHVRRVHPEFNPENLKEGSDR